MASPVKYRDHIEKIWRMKPDEKTRLGKIRLDKNERITSLPTDLWENIMADISQESVQAYPECWPLYKRLSVLHGISVDRFLLLAGSDAAIKHSFEVFVSPGD